MKVVLANQPAHRGDTIFTFTILQTKKWRPWDAGGYAESGRGAGFRCVLPLSLRR